MKKQLRLAAFAALLAVGTVSAQNADGSDGVAQTDAAGETIRLIDNKGTIKYLQSNNGITTITSTEANNRTTTTWQLGGTLTTNTTITMADADSNGTSDQTFTINGDTFTLLGTDRESGAAAVADATDTTDGIANTGFTVLVRDEATGIIKKMLATDLLQVQASRHEFTAIETGLPTASQIIIATAKDLTGSPTGLLAANVSVYRNGAKLLAGTDYSLADNSGGTLTQLTLVNRSGATAPADWTLYAGDIIEVHWVR